MLLFWLCNDQLKGLALVLFGVLGLSHILQPRPGSNVRPDTRSRPTGSFADGLPYLILAGIVIAFHNVWSGIPVVLTVIGWASLIESVLASVSRAWALKMMARVSLERASRVTGGRSCPGGACR